MDFKEYCENSELVYKLEVTVNDELAITIETSDETSMLEQLRKVDSAILETANNQYIDRAEYLAEMHQEMEIF
jgi:hypothetical protein